VLALTKLYKVRCAAKGERWQQYHAPAEAPRQSNANQGTLTSRLKALMANGPPQSTGNFVQDQIQHMPWSSNERLNTKKRVGKYRE